MGRALDRGSMERAVSPHRSGDDGSWGVVPGWYGRASLALENRAEGPLSYQPRPAAWVIGLEMNEG